MSSKNEKIRVGDKFKFDFSKAPDHHLWETIPHGFEFTLREAKGKESCMFRMDPPCEEGESSFEGTGTRESEYIVKWFIEEHLKSGLLVRVNRCGPEPKDNGHRETCYWCDAVTTPIGARNRVCGVCKK
jgi:hypothetical protein